MELSILPLHRNKEYMNETCKLINDEWKRSETARMHSLESSCDNLPTCLILLQSGRVVGHLKLTAIPRIPDACFLESVVIEKTQRGQGLGTILMAKSEEYCKQCLQLKTIYLSTKGQEKFYLKLGYVQCPPVSIYGSYLATSAVTCVNNLVPNNEQINSAPIPPPMPTNKIINNTKTYMKKNL